MPDLKSRTRGLLENLAADSEPLWVSGLALLLALLGAIVFRYVAGLEGERYEWAIYLTLGTIFPAALLLLTLSKPVSQARTRLSQRLKVALALFCLLVCVVVLFRRHQNTVTILALAQFCLIAIYAARIGRPMKPWSLFVTFIVVATAWSLSASLLWWSSFRLWFFSGDNLLETIYRFVICLTALLLVFFSLQDRSAKDEARRFRFCTAPNLAAILIIGIASVRSDQLFNTTSFSHWGVVVGPAEMVRQGGWLLWDVPSQYGFLNTLLVAILPFKSVWQSAYFLNSLLLFLSAVFLFWVLRSIQSGMRNYFFSLAVTLAAVFLMSGWPPALWGPQVFPSIGPFRFFCCYALLAILIWEYVGSKRSHLGVPLVGNILWVIGSLWSSESAAYCAAIWLPAYLLIAFNRTRAGSRDVRPRRRPYLTVAWFVAPFVLLASVAGVITLYYLLRLGHGPDWSAFFEYSLAFTGGFFALPIDASGPVCALFLIFCGISVTAVYFLRDGLMQKAMVPIAGAWGALWAISSYFVSRSHENNVTILSTIMCIVIGLTLYLFARYGRSDAWVRLIKNSYVPFLTVLLTVTFGNAGFLRLYLTSPDLGYQRNIDSHLPVIDPSLLELFHVANVLPSDPIVYSAVRYKAVEPLADGLSHDHGVTLPAWPIDNGEVISAPLTWLPTSPFVLVVPLPSERKQEFMQRFTSRARLSGWLVQNKKEQSYKLSSWFYDQVMKTHTPTRVFENADWQLIWFEYKSGD
ncbi:MAG: hypothetical protein QOJ64_1594 [Acidobacteriota bacterium]|nr:hypothetical protein [Acidobacteriota bacterium]